MEVRSWVSPERLILFLIRKTGWLSLEKTELDSSSSNSSSSFFPARGRGWIVFSSRRDWSWIATGFNPWLSVVKKNLSRRNQDLGLDLLIIVFRLCEN